MSMIVAKILHKAGNRMTNTKDSLNSINKTNTLNQYLNQRNELPAWNIQDKNFKYDKNGNLIEDEKQKYEYDYKNKLIRVTDKVYTWKIIEFVYDVLCRRIEKKCEIFKRFHTLLQTKISW